MTQLDCRSGKTTTAGRSRSRGPAHGRSREARVRRSFDGVVASYIREISLRDGGRPRPAAAGGSAASE
jgi:hypothetical protein